MTACMLRTVADQDVEQSFLTAFLLSGNAANAEAAVLIAVEGGGNLLRDSVIASTRSAPHSPALHDDTRIKLPAELRRVRHLPDHLRKPFVLRMLLQWSRKECAGLLDRSVEEIDQCVCLAMRALVISTSDE